jgi:hypothetical protein
MAQTEKKPNSKPLSIKSYESLGRTLESIFQGGYINHHRVYKINFIRGIFFGFGVAIGGTFMIACLIWTLSLFTQLPLVGNFVETIRDSIDTQQSAL